MRSSTIRTTSEEVTALSPGLGILTAPLTVTRVLYVVPTIPESSNELNESKRYNDGITGPKSGYKTQNTDADATNFAWYPTLEETGIHPIPGINPR